MTVDLLTSIFLKAPQRPAPAAPGADVVPQPSPAVGGVPARPTSAASPGPLPKSEGKNGGETGAVPADKTRDGTARGTASGLFLAEGLEAALFALRQEFRPGAVSRKSGTTLGGGPHSEQLSVYETASPEPSSLKESFSRAYADFDSSKGLLVDVEL